jgi:hypothetical protein
MSHALVWHELDYNSGSINEFTPQLPVVNLGGAGAGSTIRQGRWGVKYYRLKWLNTSVENVKLWLDTYAADVYNTVKKHEGLDLVRDYGFKYKYLLLDQLNLSTLPEAKASTNGPLSLDGSGKLRVIGKIGIYDPLPNDVVLVKNQEGTGRTQNGIYVVSSEQATSYLAAHRDSSVTFRSGFGVSVDAGFGTTYYLSYTQKDPLSIVSPGSDTVKWIERNITDIVSDAKYATSVNHTSTGAGAAKTLTVTSTQFLGSTASTYLNVNDRIIVRSQTDRRENGLYKVASKYATNQNSLLDPRSSTNILDRYWASASIGITQLISQGRPIEITVLNGTNQGGKVYRYYPDNATTNNYKDLNWSEATYHNTNITVDAYLELTASNTASVTFDGAGIGTFSGIGTTLSAIGGTSYILNLNDELLVKDLRAGNSNQSGIYYVADVGTAVTITRLSPYDAGSGISALSIKTLLSTNSYGGQHFFLNKEDQLASSFVLNSSGIAVSDRVIPYKYANVGNSIVAQISGGYGVTYLNEANTDRGALSNGERVLITNQSDAYKNGIWTVSSATPDTFSGLAFTDSYRIQNAGLINVTAGTVGSGKTYLLYTTAADGTFPGSNQVKFVDYSTTYGSTGFTTATAIVTTDKLSTFYVSPTDFGTSISTGNRVVVNINSANNNKNGIYSATVTEVDKYKWNFDESFSQWWSNVTKNSVVGREKFFLGQDTSLYYVNSFEESTRGNIYVPQVNTPKKLNPTFHDYQLENYDLEWNEMDYQKMYVRAAFACTATPPSTVATGSTTYRVYAYVGGAASTFIDGENVLVICNDLYPTNTSADFGSTTKFASPNNGIYKARVSSGGTVYFQKHPDFFYSSAFSGAGKTIATPYERPSIVRVTDGYVGGVAGTISLTKKTVYMQGSVKVKGGVYTDDGGSENFILGSNVNLSYDYNNMHQFAKVAPVSFIIDEAKINGRLVSPIVFNNADPTFGTVLTIPLSTALFASDVWPGLALGDRLVFNFSNISGSTMLGSYDPFEVNGIYQCFDISTNYYQFRKVNYAKQNGHIDYFKDLLNNGTGTSSLGIITFNLKSDKDSNFTWHPSTYSFYEVLYKRTTDNAFVPYTSGTTAIGATSGKLFVTLAANDTLSISDTIKVRLKQSQTFTTQLNNNNFIVEKITFDKANLTSSIGRSNTNLGSYEVEETYWQQKYFDQINSKNLTYFYEFTAGTSVTGNSTATFIIDKSNLYGTGTTYLFNRRLSQDSSALIGYNPDGIGEFYPNDPFTSQNDFYVGPWSLETGSGSTQWYYQTSSLGTTFIDTLVSDYGSAQEDVVLVLNNVSGSLPTINQSSYKTAGDSTTTRDTYGKRDQYVLKFKSTFSSKVSLAYHSSFPDPIVPKRVTVGTATTYVLYYDPEATDRTTDTRRFILQSNLTKYNAAGVASTNNVNLGGAVSASFNGVTLDNNSTVLLKDQTDKNQNGIYKVNNVNYWEMTRASDMDSAGELIPFSTVNVKYTKGAVSVDKLYELILPQDKNYTVWTFGGAGGTNLIFNTIQTVNRYNAAAATTTSYANVTTSTSIPDVIDGYTVADQDRVLMLSQNNYQAGVGNTLRYLSRFSKQFSASLERVVTGTGSTEFSIRSLRIFQNTGTGSSTQYETYFDPNVTTVGVGTVNFMTVSSITNLAQSNYISNNDIDLLSDLNDNPSYFDPSISTITSGLKLILKDQTDPKENGLYITEASKIMLLERHPSLSTTSQIVDTLNVNVSTYDSGVSQSAKYGIWFSSPATLGSSNLYFLRQYETLKKANCKCATTANIADLNNPPTTIDGYVLEENDRILVKNQSTNSLNGIYYLFNKQTNTWLRSSDLSSDYQLVPQISIYVENGTANGDKVFVIGLSDIPSTSSTYPYTIGTSNISWTEYSITSAITSNPDLWTDLPDSKDNAVDMQSAKINAYGYSQSGDFAIAVYVPDITGTMLAFSNGKVRNQKINVEYDIAKD